MALKERYILAFILLTAFLLRIGGIFHGYPLVVLSDEIATLSASLKMIGTYSFHAADAVGYYYPALLSYVYLPFLALFLALGRWLGIFTDVQQIKETVLLNLGFFIPAARLISVILGTASVYLVYKIVKLLFNKVEVALLSSWFLAISFFHVSNSHFAQTWTAQTFFILLVLYWSVVFFQKKTVRPKDYLIGGFLVGCAFGINFVGIVSYYWLVVVHFLKNVGQNFFKIFIKNKNFWLANIILFLIILIIYWLNPNGLNNYFNRLLIRNPPAGYAAFQPLNIGAIKNIIFYSKSIFIIEPLFFITFLGGCFLLLKKKEWIIFCLIPFSSLIYLLMLSTMNGPMIRYALPAIPLMLIVSAYFVVNIFDYFSGKKIWKIILIIFFSLYALVFSTFFDIRLTKGDTAVFARNWLVENIPEGSSIRNYDLADSLNLVENKKSLELIENQLPELFSTKRKYLSSLKEEDYPRPSYLVVNYEKMSDSVPEFDYIILSNSDKSVLDNKIKEISEHYVLVNKFYPSGVFADAGKWPGRDELGIPFNHFTFKPFSLFKMYGGGTYIEIYRNKKLLPK